MEAVKCSLIQGFKPLLCYFILFCLFFKVELIYNVVLVSGVQQSDSVKILFQILFHYSLLQDIEHSSMFYFSLNSLLMFLRKISEGKAERLSFGF